MLKNIQECKFCNLDDSKYYNTILEETNNFIVIPSIGSLVDGYVLIVSKKHYYNMLELDGDLKLEYLSLINKYRLIFKNTYNKYPIIFEHGTSIYDEISASSIVHAHAHIVNHNFFEETKLLNDIQLKKLNDFYSIYIKDKSYIMYINPNGEYFISYNFKTKSQLMRYFIAKDLGFNNVYNWEYNPFHENIKSTINKIKNY